MSVRPKIDEADVRILKILLKDPRTSFAEIAKDCEMSTNAIRMRFKRLKEVGVIKGAIMQVNPRSLGYDCIAFLGIQADANKETKVYDFLEKTPNIILNVKYMGRYNILSFAALKSLDKLAHTIEQVGRIPHVRNVEESIWVDLVRMDHPENLIIKPFHGVSDTNKSLPNDEKPKPTITFTNVASESAEKYFEETFELDKIDRSIIRILSENARMSFRKIAKQLGISTQSVIRRYEKLKKEVAPYSTITLDLGKIGYLGTAVFLIKVSYQHKISEVVDELLLISNVIVAIRTLGTFDVVVVVPFEDVEQLLRLKRAFSSIQGIMNFELLLREPFRSWPRNVFSKLNSNKPQTT